MARQKRNNQDDAVRRMVGQHLNYREQTLAATPAGLHLDEDQLATFVEGRLTQSESAPLMSHLVACSFCRRATSQLIRLESALGETEAVEPPAQQPEAGRIRRLLEGLAARVLPQSDEDAVFAYHAPAEDLQQAEQSANAAQEKETKETAADADAATRETND
ncbi:MAG TPA: hypothetical protein VNA19_06305 [Pyrinomonadaceae bacterium]|jgi:hypothetical protein|nr:hypothetical protein [Pyrinomonadaceae bacterium]